MSREVPDAEKEGERIQIRLLAQASVPRRIQSAISVTATVRRLAWQAIEKRFPDETGEERRLLFAEFVYGRNIARLLRDMRNPVWLAKTR